MTNRANSFSLKAHIRNSPLAVNLSFSNDNVTINKGSPTSSPYLMERIMMQTASHGTVLGILVSMRANVVFASQWQSQGHAPGPSLADYFFLCMNKNHILPTSYPFHGHARSLI